MTPFVGLMTVYIVLDPFRVVRKYDSYYEPPTPVTLNRDFVSTETFLRHQTDYRWDSFIMGSSRSGCYQASDWAPHINSSRIFHFDASGETLYGIHKKLQFLDQRSDVSLRHILIILDADVLRTTTNSAGILFVKHPLLSGQSRIAFQLEYLKAALAVRFMFAYLDYMASHEVKPYMVANSLLGHAPMEYDLRHNEIRAGEYERLIASDPVAYYEPRKAIFYERSPVQEYYDALILGSQKILLEEIASILKRHKTDFRIVISPLYDQRRLSLADLGFLKRLFGADSVCDYSGINEITLNVRNYYEDSHYRPHVARRIMAEIYRGGQ